MRFRKLLQLLVLNYTAFQYRWHGSILFTDDVEVHSCAFLEFEGPKDYAPTRRPQYLTVVLDGQVFDTIFPRNCQYPKLVVGPGVEVTAIRRPEPIPAEKVEALRAPELAGEEEP